VDCKSRKTRSSADAEKPARRVYMSVKVTKHSTIPYVSFLLCNSNFVFKTRRFYDIQPQKCRDLEIGVRSHSRSLKVVPFDRLCTVSYSLVTLSLKCTVFEIFDFKNAVSLKTGLGVRQGHWNVTMRYSAYDFILTFHSNYMALFRVVSEIFNVEKCRDLEIGVRSHSMSLRVVPFCRSCIVSN